MGGCMRARACAYVCERARARKIDTQTTPLCRYGILVRRYRGGGTHCRTHRGFIGVGRQHVVETLMSDALQEPFDVDCPLASVIAYTERDVTYRYATTPILLAHTHTHTLPKCTQITYAYDTIILLARIYTLFKATQTTYCYDTTSAAHTHTTEYTRACAHARTHARTHTHTHTTRTHIQAHTHKHLVRTARKAVESVEAQGRVLDEHLFSTSFDG